MEKKDLVPSGVAFFLAIIAWIFPNIEWYIKVIISLLLITVSIAICCFNLASKLKQQKKQLDNLNQELAKVKQFHDALSVQHKEMTAREKRYIYALKTLEKSLHMAFQNTKAAKLSDIYVLFLGALNNIENDGL